MQSPLIRKILVFGILSGMISLVLACAGFGIVEFYKIKNEATVKLRSQIDMLAYNLQPAILFDDREAADTILQSLRDDNSITKAALYRSDGREFVSFIRSNASTDIKLSKSILYQQKIIGRVEVESIYLGIADRFITYLFISLIIILLSIPAAYILSEPIRAQVAKAVVQLELQSNRLRLLAVELSETEQRERKRFARLLHDHLQQLLVASKLRLDLMERKAEKVTKEDLAQARHFVEQAISAARSLTTELRPPVLYEGGLAPALGFLARKFNEQYQFKVNLEFKGKKEPESDIIKWVLYTAIEELLLNIIKYAEVKECLISFNGTEEGISVQVMDHGKGFDPDIIDAQKQSGFGLFSIRERFKALEGTLNIRSSPGHGSTFELTIPYKVNFDKLEQEEATPEKKMLYTEAMSELSQNDLVKILVVDDHSMVRQAISSMLNTTPNFRVVAEAEDGEDAVQKARELRPDVVIMDLNMPRLNGIAATRIIHKDLPGIKIIGLSVQDEKTVSDAMREAGAVAFFNKGTEITKLIETIKVCMAA